VKLSLNLSVNITTAPHPYLGGRGGHRSSEASMASIGTALNNTNEKGGKG